LTISSEPVVPFGTTGSAIFAANFQVRIHPPRIYQGFGIACRWPFLTNHDKRPVITASNQ
jgi:hypothetical protein